MRHHCSASLPLLLAALLLFPPIAAAEIYDRGVDPPYGAGLLLESETGTVLYEHNARTQRSPASTQKLLLQLVVMDLVAAGKASLTDEVTTSAWASRIGGAQVYLRQGEVFPLEHLMQAIAISSANDACVAVAEHIGGSVDGFVSMMNAKARGLGLETTRCVNVHGLDDTPMNNRNLTTAFDLSVIARALMRHDKTLEWSSTRIHPFRGGKFTLYTTNKLLGKFSGLDGLKTGYTNRARFCLVATARRGDMRLLSVIMGAPRESVREAETRRLLSWGFNNFSRVPLAEAGEQVGRIVLDWGLEPEVTVEVADTFTAILTPLQKRQLHRQLLIPTEHPAPVEAGEELGRMQVSLGDSVLAMVDLVAGKSVGRMGFWDMLMSYF